MTKKTVRMIMLASSLLLAALLIKGTISMVTCSLIIAAALVLYGVTCRRCR